MTRDTLDKEDQLSIKSLGEEETATKYFAILKDIDYRVDYWKLGYIEDSLVELIVPQKFNEEVGAINYIGVVPETRGNGYVVDLLQKGTEILFNDGVKKIIADIDKENFPMENVLIKIGFKEENIVLIYTYNL
ncbi:MAG: GNAT family N-acetyltransferase [Halanaerobiales bacterium]|nr:GNAT family N-acetyltransferase [Halanaerobiales bacterium]